MKERRVAFFTCRFILSWPKKGVKTRVVHVLKYDTPPRGRVW